MKLINITSYLASFFIITFFADSQNRIIYITVAAISLISQVLLFWKHDKKSFLIFLPLLIYALFLGFLQETLFIHLDILTYENAPLFPPIWVLAIYPLFSLCLNSSLSFINKNLSYAFLVGGFGSITSYFFIEKMKSVSINGGIAYIFLFLSWGIYLSILTLLNRKLIAIREKYTCPTELKKPITAFFDNQCSFCAREMENLKKRNQTGETIYACPASHEDLSEITTAFTYEEAMKTIHALDHQGKILKGTKTISAIFARADLPFLAISLQAPVFSYLFNFIYIISAKLRPRHK
jgi:predicted DCC family thiol-disulfide oxidoreductase YuxK